MSTFVSCVWSLRWWVWLVVAAAMMAATILVPPIQFDQSIEGFFPADDSGIAEYRNARGLFGNDDLAIVAYEDPDLWSEGGMKRLTTLSDELANEIPGVLRVETLEGMPVPWRIDDAVEGMATGWVSPLRIAAARANVGEVVRITADVPERLEDFRSHVCRHPLFRGVVVDPEGKMTALLVTMGDPREIDHKAVIRAIREHGDSFAERHRLDRVSVAGPPVLVSDGFDSLDRDNKTLGAVAMALMALTMLVAVRNPGWALLPLAAGWATWQFLRTMLWYFDLRLTLSSGPIVAQTVVLCMPAAAHLAMRFRENWKSVDERRRSALETLSDVAVPIAWCAATAAAGYFAAWATSDVVPVSQFGMTMCISNLAAGSLTFLLAAGAMGLSRRPRPTLDPEVGPQGLSRMTRWVVEHPKSVILGFVLPSILIATGMSRLALESNYINIFRSRARVLLDYRHIERRLGGIGVIELVTPAPSEVDGEWLRNLEQAAFEIKEMSPAVVSGVFSVSNLLLPEDWASLSEEVVDNIAERKATFLDSQKFRYLLDRAWNRSEGSARILVRIQDSESAEEKERFMSRLNEWADSRPNQPVIVTGLSRLLMQITSSVIGTSFASATYSAGLIGIMLLLALRSPTLTLLAMLPTTLSVGLVLGIMGWIGLKIDMTTALVASVAIGLSVDDTFHCLLHWQQEMDAGRTPREALIAAYASSGPGVVLSSSAVTLGLMASMTSEFVPTANFGWLVGIATLGGSAGNLIVLPAILSLRKGFRSAS